MILAFNIREKLSQKQTSALIFPNSFPINGGLVRSCSRSRVGKPQSKLERGGTLIRAGVAAAEVK